MPYGHLINNLQQAAGHTVCHCRLSGYNKYRPEIDWYQIAR